MSNKLYFPKRIPEPKQMEQAEMLVFEKLAESNYNRWVMPIVLDASQYLNKTQAKILDVGCGPGLLAKGFAEHNRNWKIVGTDISGPALKLAKKNCLRLKNAEFTKGSVYRLAFADDKFDLVVCKDSFHHFEKPAAALREMFRVLKPGGALYLQDLRRDLPLYLLRRAIPADNPIKKLQFFSARAAYLKTEIAAMLARLKIKRYKLLTQRLNGPLHQQISKLGVQDRQLREAFQARFLLLIKK